MCRKCGYKFEAEVLEEGEAKEKKIRPVPVQCPRCHGTDIERV